MKNKKILESLLLMAFVLGLPFCAYANQEEHQVDTHGALVESAIWLESMIADIQSSIPEVSLEALLNAAEDGALGTLEYVLFPHIHLFYPQVQLFRGHEGVEIHSKWDVLAVFVVTMLDIISLDHCIYESPDLPYMPGLKARFQLAMLLTALRTATRIGAIEADNNIDSWRLELWESLENDSSEEL